MPSAVVKSLAKKSGRSISEVERLWNKAKVISSQDNDGKPNYALTVGILKKMMKKETAKYRATKTEIVGDSMELIREFAADASQMMHDAMSSMSEFMSQVDGLDPEDAFEVGRQLGSKSRQRMLDNLSDMASSVRLELLESVKELEKLTKHLTRMK